MKTIHYLKGDATVPQAKGIKIIAISAMILEAGEKVLYWPFPKGGKNRKKNTGTGTVSETKIILGLEKQIVQVE
jgi:hypothetical protein